MDIKEITASHVDEIVRLNEAVVAVTSPMDAQRVMDMLNMGVTGFVTEEGARLTSFILIMDMAVPYENDNFAWFTDRVGSFVYVDRIVVSQEGRGQGIGQALYQKTYDYGRAMGRSNVCAEVDFDPPNVPSLVFHEKAGFIQRGTRATQLGKTEAMLVKEL